jgi:hypothetical protein
MASDVERPSAAMEAGGFYNKYSLIPSGGGGASRRSFQGISLFSAAPARFARHGNGREPRIGRHSFLSERSNCDQAAVWLSRFPALTSTVRQCSSVCRPDLPEVVSVGVRDEPIAAFETDTGQ